MQMALQNINFRSEIAIKDIYDIDEGFEGTFLQDKDWIQRRFENKHILANLDEKFHCNFGLRALMHCLYPPDDPILKFFGVDNNFPWVTANGKITYIREDHGVMYVILQSQHVACLKYIRAWHAPTIFILHHTFKTDGRCSCLAHYENGVVVCIKFPQEFTSETCSPQLHIFDGSGKLERQIIYHDNKPIFNDPQDIVVHQDTIIVSDQGKKSVIFVSGYGILIRNFTHEEISCPHGLCIDEFLNIYVASGRKIIQLTEDASKNRTIVSLPNHQTSFLHFCRETNLLSASLDGTGKIALYQFLQNNHLTTQGNREDRKKSLKDDPPYFWIGAICFAILYISIKLPK